MPNIIGLISILFLTSVIYYLSQTTPEFSFSSRVISDLGILPQTRRKYLITLLVYTLLRLIFFVSLFTHFSLWNNYFIVTSFAVAYISFISTAFITIAHNPKLHAISALTSAIFTVILILFLGLQFLQSSPLVGITNILLANSMLWGSWYIQHTKGLNSYFQIYFIANLFIWDNLILFFLLGLIK